MKHNSNHNILSTWILQVEVVAICVSRPAIKASRMVDVHPKRTTSSHQAMSGTTSSSTTISSHMMAEGLPGISNNSGKRVRAECPTETIRPAIEMQGKDAAISSSIIAVVAGEAVVIQAEGCSTRILCKLECRIRGKIGAATSSSKLGQ